MKTYQLHLKGTKIRKSTDATVELKAINKSQAFNLAYYFFEKGTELPFMSEFFDVKAVQEFKGKVSNWAIFRGVSLNNKIKMTRQEYTKLANGLYSKYKNDCYNLALEYVISTLDCKKGDIAEDNDGTKIIVESIVITDSLSGIPSYYLTGSLLKKDLTKRVDGSKFTIHPHYLKQIHKS